MRFLSSLAIGAICMVLVACDGGNTSTTSSAFENSISCIREPVVTPVTTFYGVTPEGGVGTWTFDTATLASHYVVGVSTAKTALIRDVASCSYTNSSSSVLKTAFSSANPDLAVSAATVAGKNTAALLIASPETELANATGTYNLMIVESERASGGHHSYIDLYHS